MCTLLLVVDSGRPVAPGLHSVVWTSLQVTGVPEDQILVAVFPGLPTSAELFILPPKNLTERRKGNEEDLEQVSDRTLGQDTCLPPTIWRHTVIFPATKGGELSPIGPAACGSAQPPGRCQQPAWPRISASAQTGTFSAQEGKASLAALIPTVGIPANLLGSPARWPGLGETQEGEGGIWVSFSISRKMCFLSLNIPVNLSSASGEKMNCF